jgi:hypothetical protein
MLIFKKTQSMIAIIAIAIALSVGVATVAQAATEQPTCAEGTHFEGRFETSESCSRKCVKRRKGKCVKRRMVCKDTSEWVGSCVADEVDEDDPIVQEDAVDEPDLDLDLDLEESFNNILDDEDEDVDDSEDFDLDLDLNF